MGLGLVFKVGWGLVFIVFLVFSLGLVSCGVCCVMKESNFSLEVVWFLICFFIRYKV